MHDLKEAKKLWIDLGGIPVDEKENIDESFLHFSIATSIYDIWHWFEDTYDLSVYDDLMFPKEDYLIKKEVSKMNDSIKKVIYKRSFSPLEEITSIVYNEEEKELNEKKNHAILVEKLAFLLYYRNRIGCNTLEQAVESWNRTDIKDTLYGEQLFNLAEKYSRLKLKE